MRTQKQRRLLRAFKDGDEDFVIKSRTLIKVSLYDAGILIPTTDDGHIGGWKLTEIGQHIVNKMRRTSKRKLGHESI